MKSFISSSGRAWDQSWALKKHPWYKKAVDGVQS